MNFCSYQIQTHNQDLEVIHCTKCRVIKASGLQKSGISTRNQKGKCGEYGKNGSVLFKTGIKLKQPNSFYKQF